MRRWTLTQTLGTASSLMLLFGIAAARGDSDSDLLPPLSPKEEKLREERVQVLQKGVSSKAARLTAIEQLPLDTLTAAQRRRADEVLKSISLFRELPIVSFEVEPDVYQYFLDYPDMAVAIWKAMGISKFQMSQTSATEYDADCGDGTSGQVEVLHRSDRQVLVYCDGGFKSPLMTKPIRSHCLLSLQWNFYRGKDNKTFVKHRAAMFVSFPSQTVETAARVISPISNHIIDHNFREISLFVHMMSLAMQRQPGWVERLADKMDGVLDSRKQQFLKLTAQVYVRARKKEVAQTGAAEPSIEEVLGPVRGASATQPADRPTGSRLFPRTASKNTND